MKIKLLIQFILLTLLTANIWYWARVFFDPIENTFPSNCPVSITVNIDTENKDTIWTEIVFWFNPDEVKILWIQDWWIYDMPIWSKYFKKFFYYSTTNLGKKYFNGYGKLWGLIIQSVSWIKKSQIKIINEIWKTNDSNVVWSDFKDILDQTIDWNYNFDNTLECKNKLSDFNIFQEEDLSKLTNDQAVKELENKIIETKNKSNNKNTIKYILIWSSIFTILLALVITFIVYKKKKNKNENI